jgi:hypothetical protein
MKQRLDRSEGVHSRRLHTLVDVIASVTLPNALFFDPLDPLAATTPLATTAASWKIVVAATDWTSCKPSR